MIRILAIKKLLAASPYFRHYFNQAEVEVHHGDFDPATKADG
jgi:hypothetical protein